MCIFNSQLFSSAVVSLHGPIWRRWIQSWLRAAEILQGNKLNSRKTERTWLNGPFPSHPLSHLPTYRTFLPFIPPYLLPLVLLHTEFLSSISLPLFPTNFLFPLFFFNRRQQTFPDPRSYITPPTDPTLENNFPWLAKTTSNMYLFYSQKSLLDFPSPLPVSTRLSPPND